VSPGFRQRLPLFGFLALGFVLWRSGFGVFAMERNLTWRLPVPHSQVQELELQVWDDQALLQRQIFPTSGLAAEPTTKLPLVRGPHRAIALVKLAGESTARSFQREFDPLGETDVLLDFSAR
jgi:hypothetical protein